VNNKLRATLKDDDGNDLTLYMIPGAETDLSSPTIVDFPFYSINQVCNLQASFNEGIPLGFEQSRTMEIEVDLNQMTGTVSGVDFEDVQRYILRGGGAVKRDVTVGSITYSYAIPNRWILMKGTTILFDGFQNPVPSNKIDIDLGNLTVNYKIVCTDIFTTILKNTSPYQLEYRLINHYTETDSTKYTQHKYYDGSAYFHSWRQSGFTFKTLSISDLFSAVNDCMTYYVAPLFCRQAETVVLYTGIVRTFSLSIELGNEYSGDLSGVLVGSLVTGTGVPANTYVTQLNTSTFLTNNNNTTADADMELTVYGVPTSLGAVNQYKVVQDIDYSLGDVLPMTSRLYINRVLIGTKRVAGIFARYRQSLLSYPSLYDFLNDEYKGHGLKGIKNYSTLGLLTFASCNIYKMLDRTTAKTLSKTDIIEGQYTITTNQHYVSSVNNTLKDGDTGSQLEFKTTELGTTGNDNAVELNPFFDTATMALPMDSLTTYYQQTQVFQTKILYKDTDLYKLHHFEQYHLGDLKLSPSYTETNELPTPNTTNHKQFWEDYNEWVGLESTQHGAYLICDKIKSIFNAPNIIEIECVVTGDSFDIRDIGDNITIDIADFEFQNLCLDIYGTKGIITNVEQDVIKNECKMNVIVYEPET